MHLAILAGLCASAGSLFGKMCGLSVIEDQITLRIICFGLMLFCNGTMWTLYSKSLQYSSSSLTPTIICAASNYICSALSGFLIFGEVTSLMWWSGTILILTGLLFIIHDNPPDVEEPKKTK